MSVDQGNQARQLGERLRRIRLAQRRQQTVVAGLAGITTDYLYQIERGLKLPSLPVLIELARVLGQPVSALLGEGPASNTTAEDARPRSAADEPPTTLAKFDPIPGPGMVRLGEDLYRAITTLAGDTAMRSSSDLGDEVERAWDTWQRHPQRYSELSATAPALVTGVEQQLRELHSADAHAERRVAAGHASDLYGLLRSFCKRVGRIELSLLAADRAIRSAELADDPTRLAAAQWNLAHVLLADNEPAGAEDVAMAGMTALQPGASAESATGAALRGALLLVASMAAVRRGDAWTARARVDEASRLAERTGEQNACWTAFGPTNVAMHAASVELMAGQASEGLHLAEQVDHRASPSIERRVAFLLDQAQGWHQKRDNAQVLVLLIEAEQEAPEDLRYRPAAKSLIANLIQRGRRSVAEQAASLAGRLDLVIS